MLTFSFFLFPLLTFFALGYQEVDRKNFGLTLDFGHCLMAGENPAHCVAAVARSLPPTENRPGGGLFGVHLGDGYGRLGAEDGLAFGTVHPHAALEFVYYLVKTKFAGHIYFDTFPRNENPRRECEVRVCSAYSE